jgi:hypothetical protein
MDLQKKIVFLAKLTKVNQIGHVVQTSGTINTVMEAAKDRSAVQAPLAGGKQGQYSNVPMPSLWSYNI